MADVVDGRVEIAARIDLDPEGLCDRFCGDSLAISIKNLEEPFISAC